MVAMTVNRRPVAEITTFDFGVIAKGPCCSVISAQKLRLPGVCVHTLKVWYKFAEESLQISIQSCVLVSIKIVNVAIDGTPRTFVNTCRHKALKLSNSVSAAIHRIALAATGIVVALA